MDLRRSSRIKWRMFISKRRMGSLYSIVSAIASAIGLKAERKAIYFWVRHMEKCQTIRTTYPILRNLSIFRLKATQKSKQQPWKTPLTTPTYLALKIQKHNCRSYLPKALWAHRTMPCPTSKTVNSTAESRPSARRKHTRTCIKSSYRMCRSDVERSKNIQNHKYFWIRLPERRRRN